VQLRRFRERWGHLGVDDLDERAIDEWCEDRNAAGLSNATLKAERQVLRVFLRWVRDRDFISRVPRIPQTRGVPKTKPRPLAESNLRAIFEEIGTSAKPQVRALEPFCMVQLHCGLRREEARFLSWADVDFDAGEVVVTNKPEAGFTIKDAEERAIRMNALLYQYLDQLRQRRTDREPWVCVNERYAQWSLGVSKWMRELFNDAGIGTQHGTSHRFRHTFATHLLRSGTDLATLRDLLGHSDISVTSRYLGASPQRAKAVAALAQLPGPGSAARDEQEDIQPSNQR
jgi:site-specific recombinase XerD